MKSGAKIISIAIWIVIQKIYLLTWDIHCSIQQSASHCLHGTKFLDLDRNLDSDLDNFAPCKQGTGI